MKISKLQTKKFFNIGPWVDLSAKFMSTHSGKAWTNNLKDKNISFLLPSLGKLLKSVTKFLAMIVLNLFTSKAAAKFHPLFYCPKPYF
jgi:hypothetical protein